MAVDSIDSYSERIRQSYDLIMGIANNPPDEEELKDYKKRTKKGEANRQYLYDSVKLELLLIRENLSHLAKACGWIIQDQSDQIKAITDQMRVITSHVAYLSEIMLYNEREKRGLANQNVN